MLVKKFAKPDRSDYQPSPFEPNDDGVMDVGYHKGSLCDGRPYHLECWRMDDMLMATIIFSDAGLSAYKRQDMACLVEAEGLVDFTTAKRFLQCGHLEDDAEQSMWALNLMLANAKGTYGKLQVELNRYR